MILLSIKYEIKRYYHLVYFKYDFEIFYFLKLAKLNRRNEEKDLLQINLIINIVFLY